MNVGIQESSHPAPVALAAPVANPRRSVADVHLGRSQQALVHRMAALARDKFAPRAAHFDESATFPAADFEDLVREGLHAPTVPLEHGGLGLGAHRGDAFTLWMLTKEIAKADLSLARCWEGHANSLAVLRWARTRAAASRSGWPASWSAERSGSRGAASRRRRRSANEAGSARRSSRSMEAGRSAERRRSAPAPAEPTARFCSSTPPVPAAPVTPRRTRGAAPPGLRPLRSGDHVRRLLVESHRHASHRQPHGPLRRPLRARPRRHRPPGQYLLEGWQTSFVPHYAATFLGAAEAAYEYALEYLIGQKRDDDPYVQHHVAGMALNVESAPPLAPPRVTLWDIGEHEEAQLAGSRARHLLEHYAEETVQHAVRACGARSPQPAQRARADLSRPVDLRATRQRRPHPRHDRPLRSRKALRCLVLQAVTSRGRCAGGGLPHRIVWAFALGYFVFYAPYAALIKIVTTGQLARRPGSRGSRCFRS